MTDRLQNAGKLTRRQALVTLGGSAAALALTGCEVQVSGDEPSAGKSVPELKIPDAKGKLPEGDVTFRWIDSGDLKALYEEPVLAAYTKKHPNIKTQYDGSGWDQVNQVVPLGIRNGTCPDVFAMPQTVPAQTAIDEGWVQPIEDLIPDFDSWKKNFPETIFIPGVHIFDGKLYTWPMSSDRRLGQMIFYDVENMKAGGYDAPEDQIATWDDFREAAKKVTAAGKGKIYGLMAAGKGLSGYVNGFARTAGWHEVGGMDFNSGEYTYANEHVLEAIELLQAIKADKSMFPGFASLSDAEARGRMPNAVAGMIIDGPWDIPQWPEVDPNWKFDLFALPTPEKGGTYTVPYQEDGANNTWVYKDSKYPEVAGDLYSYMGSVEGQTQLVVLSQGNLVSVMPEATEKADVPGLLDPHAKKATDLATKLMRTAPFAQVRNPETAKVALKTKAVKPSFKDVIEGLFTGQLDDPKKELTKLDDAMNKNLDSAVAAAKKKGAKVNREDWVFPNWDPSKNYTQKEYDEL